jgi:hypothetical protein
MFASPLLSLPPPLTLPFKCNKKGSWPGRHFLHLTPPSPPPIGFGTDLGNLTISRGWPPFEVVSMIADSGQQQWSCTNFWLSDRTLRSPDRILEFSQELVKICAAANNFDFRIYFGMSGRYNQPVQYGRDSAHKSRAGWAVFSLGVYMTERQHFYKDLNESSSASPGGSQQLEIPPSPNNKRAANFFQIRWYFTRCGDFNTRQDSIVRLDFC